MQESKIILLEPMPHDHKQYCTVGIEEEARKKQIKGTTLTQQAVVEAYIIVEDLEDGTKSKWKNRTVGQCRGAVTR